MQYDDRMFMYYEHQLCSNYNNTINNNNDNDCNSRNDNSNINNSNCRFDFDQFTNFQNFQNCIVSKRLTTNTLIVPPCSVFNFLFFVLARICIKLYAFHSLPSTNRFTFNSPSQNSRIFLFYNR